MMTADELKRRRRLNFEQAEGLAPLPDQLAFGQVSDELRAVLWAFIHGQIQESTHKGTYVVDPWADVLRTVHVYRNHRPSDEFSSKASDVVGNLKPIFFEGSYHHIYGWLQFVMEHLSVAGFSARVDSILNYCRAPYRVVDGYVICPIASEQDAATVKAAFADLKKSGLDGAREHLRSAATNLTQGKFADSVRESIHAVESVARRLEPSAELSKALAKLEQSASIHGALKTGFLAIYGYTSDQEGIRHALIDDANANVDETDALFMIGACSAFVSYLINKGRAANLI
jgi:hypothetical protein